MAGETQKSSITLIDKELGERARIFEGILAAMDVHERTNKVDALIGALNETCTSYSQQRVFASLVDPLIVDGELIPEALRDGEPLRTMLLPGTVHVDAEFEQFVFVEGERNWGIHVVLGEVAIIKSSIIALPKRTKIEAMMSSASGLQRIMRAA